MPTKSFGFLLLSFLSFTGSSLYSQTTITINPIESQEAFKNPLKGFRGGEYGSMRKDYIKWNELENNVSDGVQKIRDFCNNRWKNYPGSNSKVIPRVYLEYDNANWPADMQTGDYSSQQFQDRLVRLVGRLGEVWDNDPRVAYVEMGIFGKWGEQEKPAPTPAIQKLAGNAFTAAFKNKLVMVRHTWDMFQGFPFGCYWDSWAHWDQRNQYAGILSTAPRWKVAPMGGEAAYNWGNLSMQPGTSPDNTLSDVGHRNYLLTSIRELHGNHCGWVSAYNASNPAVSAGAKIIQKVFGHRFVIKDVTYPKRLMRGKAFDVSFSVVNLGSSPFYYKWPIELSLLDKTTKQPIYQRLFGNVDLTQWMPGDNWDKATGVYKTPAALYEAKGTFNLPLTVPAGQYILSLAIVDPAGLKPANRFAISNYFTGGRHPIGNVGVDQDVAGSFTLDPATFNSLQDNSLKYELAFSPKFTLTINPPGGGTSQVFSFYAGSSVTITAQLGPGQIMNPWTGDIEGDPMQKSMTITMDKPKTIGGNLASVPSWNAGTLAIHRNSNLLVKNGKTFFSMPGNQSAMISQVPDIFRATVYTLGGNQVRTLQAIDHQILWNGADSKGQSVSPGEYAIRFEGRAATHSIRISVRPNL